MTGMAQPLSQQPRQWLGQIWADGLVESLEKARARALYYGLDGSLLARADKDDHCTLKARTSSDEARSVDTIDLSSLRRGN